MFRASNRQMQQLIGVNPAFFLGQSNNYLREIWRDLNDDEIPGGGDFVSGAHA